MTKKSMTIALVAFLLVLMSLSIGATDKTFSDTKATDWYAGALSAVIDDAIINGYPDGTFRPSEHLGTDQLIKMLCVVNNLDVTNNTTGYWAQNYIDKAISLGWFEGMTIQDYTQPINRYNTMLIIANSLSSLESKDNEALYKIFISDFDDIPMLYRNAILKTFSNGIIGGYPDLSFSGKNYLTRAEAATIMHRIINENVRIKISNVDEAYATKSLFELESLSTFTDFEDSLRFEYGHYLFYNTLTEEWTPLKSTALSDYGKETVQKLLNELINYTSDLGGYLLVSGYNNNRFILSVYSDADSLKYQITINDNTNVIDMKIGSIYEDSGTSINTADSDYLSKIVSVLFGDDSQLDKEIETAYKTMNNNAAPMVTEEDDYQLTMTRDYEWFNITIK